MMQRIPMNVRRMNLFFFCDRCNTTHPFYSFARIYRLSSRNHFHHRAQRALRARHLLKQCPTPSSNRGRHVHSAGHYISNAPPRPQTKVAARAQRRLYYRSSPTPISNRGSSTCTAQAILIEVAPAESRSAGCGARRKAVRLSGRRHGVAPWASVKLPLRQAFRSRQAYPSKAQQAQAFLQAYPSKAQQAQAFPRACPSREAQARECPEASQPNPRPKCRYPQRVCPWGSTSWSKARQAQACPWAFPSREAQARAYPEASQPSPRPRSPSKARVLPAYRHPWANRPVARWHRASFCRAARSSRRGPSPRGRGECATRGGTPRARA